MTELKIVLYDDIVETVVALRDGEHALRVLAEEPRRQNQASTMLRRADTIKMLSEQIKSHLD